MFDTRSDIGMNKIYMQTRERERERERERARERASCTRQQQRDLDKYRLDVVYEVLNS